MNATIGKLTRKIEIINKISKYLTIKCTVIEILNSQNELNRVELNRMEIIEKNVELEDRSGEII